MSLFAPGVARRAPRRTHGPVAGCRRAGFLAWLFCALMPALAPAAMPDPEPLLSPDTPRIEDPDRLVRLYLDAVDRGELVVLGQALDRSMIEPVRIEYAYDLFRRTTQIKVYSKLKRPRPLPDNPDCRILGVNAVLDDGRITEVESHVWMK